ncbi:hypothetical protein EXIGLDRAFT_183049 [Exidia glandulosa HHB12029]|uniref:F-box domain-containing protein n=1 Tax=Exidia glandulosa HHB12029 TaxID=1314781 RepID=A0A165F2A4_EXIGL|nr:hypothetical protein EXIGLDRAFT_183049 [Exidia glandulosa HHB12029]
MASAVLTLSTNVDLDTALRATAASLSFARSIISITVTVTERGQWLTDDKLVDLLIRCPYLRVFVLQRWTFKELSADSLTRLADHDALRYITHWTIGSKGALSVSSMFSLLSLMPSLRSLHFGAVTDEGLAAMDSPVSLPTPACRLQELVVSDDLSIDFVHYPQLLSNSHDTLEYLKLSWIKTFDKPVEVALVQAIAPCTRLRSIESIGNTIPAPSLITACTQLECLALTHPPLKPEIAAFARHGARLRELRLVRLHHGDDLDQLDTYWFDLEDALSQLPSVRVLRLLFKGDISERSQGCYALAVAECERRRIDLFTSVDKGR